MKRSMLTFGLLALLAATSAYAEDSMAGRWGLGVARLMDGGTNALSGTYWLMDRLALDAYLGTGSQSYPDGGTDGAGNPVNTTNSNFSIGIGGRYDLAKPFPSFRLQAVRAGLQQFQRHDASAWRE